MSGERTSTAAHRLRLAAGAWWPTVRDPVLLAERRGRWQWYVVAIGTLLGLALAVSAITFNDQLLESIATATGTRALYDRASAPNVFFLPGNPYTFAINALFGIVLIGVTMLLGLLHGRRPGYFWRLHGQGGVRLFWKAAGAMLVVSLAAAAVEYAKAPGAFALRGDFGFVYGVSVVAALAALLLQTLGEEALFRGYLLRMWGALVPVRAVIVALLVTGFTSLHTVNSDFRTDFTFNFIGFLAIEVIYYWALLRTGCLAPTWGLHFANNLLAGVLVITVPGNAPDMGLVVFTDPVLSAGGTRLKSPLAYVELLASMVALVVLLAWRRSPFHLPVAPLPLPDTSTPADAVPDSDLPMPASPPESPAA